MLRFNAERYIRLGYALKRMESNAPPQSEKLHGLMEQLMSSISRNLQDIGCPLSANAAMRLSTSLISLEGEGKADRIEEFKELIADEMRQHLFFWVPPHRAGWFGQTGAAILGDECSNRFRRSAITFEMEKAANCFAFGEFTACAFHLMRVSEAGLRAFGAAIGFRAAANPNWGHVFKYYDEKSAFPRKQRTEFPWKEHGDFLEEIGGSLRAVQNAWRNDTMHLERNYDEESAKHLLVVIPAFMRKLASKIDENGEFM